MADERAAPATNGTAQPATRRPAGSSRRTILARVGLLVGVMAVVFVAVLPRIVDYGAVAAALSTLTAGQLAVLVVTTGLAYVANAAPSRVLVPGLSWPHAVGADLAGRAVVSTIPGPTDVATKFVLYRQWSIPADAATAGIVFNAFFETLSDLVLPLIATIGILVAGNEPRPTVILISVAGVVVLVLAMALLVAIVRSESLAGRLGRAIDAVARRLSRLVRRQPPSGIVEAVMQVRVRSHELLSRRGALVSYTDPYVPELQAGSHRLSSVELDKALAADWDCAVLTTDHSSFDYAQLARLPLIVDTRNALKAHAGPNIIRL